MKYFGHNSYITLTHNQFSIVTYTIVCPKARSILFRMSAVVSIELNPGPKYPQNLFKTPKMSPFQHILDITTTLPIHSTKFLNGSYLVQFPNATIIVFGSSSAKVEGHGFHKIVLGTKQWMKNALAAITVMLIHKSWLLDTSFWCNISKA